MVAVTLILDGASEPLGRSPTSLERARTPVLDRLAAAGTLTRLRTIPPGLPAGSETAIPVLLGWTPPAPVDRGMLEAAARELPLGRCERAWRIDVVGPDGGRADAHAVEDAVRRLTRLAPRHTLRRIGGHRLLLSGSPPLPPLPSVSVRVWPEGTVPPRLLGPETVVVAAPGAAAGAARLIGASVVVPAGATGGPDTDLGAKATAALEAMRAGATHVVVHVGAPDEAAHRLDADAKTEAIERADGELLAPLAEAVGERDGTLRVCPDHGCDPRTGRHDGAPVPCLHWSAGRAARAERGRRLTERGVAGLPVAAPPTGGAA